MGSQLVVGTRLAVEDTEEMAVDAVEGKEKSLGEEQMDRSQRHKASVGDQQAEDKRWGCRSSWSAQSIGSPT